MKRAAAAKRRANIREFYNIFFSSLLRSPLCCVTSSSSFCVWLLKRQVVLSRVGSSFHQFIVFVVVWIRRCRLKSCQSVPSKRYQFVGCHIGVHMNSALKSLWIIVAQLNTNPSYQMWKLSGKSKQWSCPSGKPIEKSKVRREKSLGWRKSSRSLCERDAE